MMTAHPPLLSHNLHPPPVPRLALTETDRARLPAGPLSSPMHRLVYQDARGTAHEAFLQQLWGEDWKRRAPSDKGDFTTQSDAFGFRLSVDGERWAVESVRVRRVERDRGDDAEEWWTVCHTVGDRGIDSAQLLFNARVLQPGERLVEVVAGLLSAAGGSMLAPEALARLRAVEEYRAVEEWTGFHEEEGAQMFRCCTAAVGGVGAECNFEWTGFSFRVRPWPHARRFDERIGRDGHRQTAAPPAGPFSHTAFLLKDIGPARRKVELHQLFGKVFGTNTPQTNALFGFNLIIDGRERRICCVWVYLLESDSGGEDHLINYSHTVGPSGTDAFKLLFNSELLPPGDGARVLDAMLPGRPALDRVSQLRMRAVRADRYVRAMTGFGVHDAWHAASLCEGREIVSFCTCCAYPQRGGWRSDPGFAKEVGGEVWEFQTMVFDVQYEV
jgi:hypothetical protein